MFSGGKYALTSSVVQFASYGQSVSNDTPWKYTGDYATRVLRPGHVIHVHNVLTVGTLLASISILFLRPSTIDHVEVAAEGDYNATSSALRIPRYSTTFFVPRSRGLPGTCFASACTNDTNLGSQLEIVHGRIEGCQTSAEAWHRPSLTRGESALNPEITGPPLWGKASQPAGVINFSISQTERR